MMRRRTKGAAMVEYVIMLITVMVPMTFGLVAIAELMWTWHSVVDYTRLGARYAATHCWQAGGQNVISWMRQNPPAIPDQAVFRDGTVEITAQYYKRNPDTGQMEEFACDGDCSTACIPDTVTIHLRGYEFRMMMSYLRLPPVQIPDFSASMPIESAGCDPETGNCQP